MPTIFDQFEACSVRRDGNAFAELFTEDAVMEFPFAKQRFAGREAIRARAVTAWSASPVIVAGFADRIISGHGDDVCVEYTARVAVEGRTHDVRIVLRLRLHEGRIAHMREYLDPTALAEVRGATTIAVLHRYHEAMRTKSADALANLYAPDAIHAFPFFMANGVFVFAGCVVFCAVFRAGWRGSGGRDGAVPGARHAADDRRTGRDHRLARAARARRSDRPHPGLHGCARRRTRARARSVHYLGTCGPTATRRLSYPVAFRRRSRNVRGWERKSNSVYWFALGVALVGCATHHGDDDGMIGSGSDAMHLEVEIDTPMLHWTDGVADVSNVHAIRVDDTDGTRTDVTDQATFAVSPGELGAVASATLTPSGQLAGPGQLMATVGTMNAAGSFTVLVTDTVPGTADPTAATLFANATLDSAPSLTVAYPPAAALIPPNIGQMDVHRRDTQ